MTPDIYLAHTVLLLIALPLQLGLVVLNGRTRWLTPGELRFWGIAVFVFVELVHLAVSGGGS
jgi:hypothetical protein